MQIFTSLSIALALGLAAPAEDLREHYDVQAYDLQFALDPDTQTLEGVVTVRAKVTAERLETLQLDLKAGLEVLAAAQEDGPALAWEHAGDRLSIALSAPLAAGDELAVRVRYRGNPKARGGFDGFHWVKTPSGKPWINTSCQGSGAHSWWPCKASYFHPEDKPDAGTTTLLVVPADLYGVSNGRLVGVEKGTPDWFEPKKGRWKTYSWRHPYPLETYAVTLNVAPYVVVEKELKMPGIDGKVPFVYYVLPESADKAALQFEDVPRMIEIYSQAFGPWPFPDSKFGLVETNFWGMEHSTAVAYGSSYPAWRKKHGETDPYAGRNRYFDYILIHECAHEWWGNAVSADDWGHFWIHEGFGTYAEGVYVEFTQGREVADEYFATQRRGSLDPNGRLWRGEKPESGQAYTGLIYSKGATVLNTLRHYVDDDEAWWKSLRDFNLAFRYKNADTEDFRAILEGNTGRSWEQFFQEWFYGTGAPTLKGSVAAGRDEVRVAVTVEGEFHVPLDVAWKEGTKEVARRVWLEPGENVLSLPSRRRPQGLSLRHIERVLCTNEIEVEG